MRYREIIKEETSEPRKWFEADLRTVIAWMETLNASSEFASPSGNDTLVLLGLVGDPDLKYKDIYIKGKRAFDILNSDEPITADTKTKLVRLLTPSEADSAGGYSFGDRSDDNPDAWVIAVDNRIATVNNQLLAKDYGAQFATSALLHEAMHRGIAIWRKLVEAGYISPGSETRFALLDSNESRVTGEHCVIYNRVDPNGGFTKAFTEWWIEDNARKLRQFGIGTDDFNNRYIDLQDEEPRQGTEDQVRLWLNIVYDKISQELGTVIQRKIISSSRPRVRGQSAQSRQRPRPITGTGTVRVDSRAAQVTQVLTNTINSLKQGQTPNWNSFARELAQATGHRNANDTLIQQVIQELKANGTTFGVDNIQYATELLIRN